MKQNKFFLRLTLVSSLAILGLVFFLALDFRKEQKQQEYLQFVTDKYSFAYKTIYNQQKQMAETLYTGIMKRYKIAELYEDVISAEGEEMDRLRQELLHRTMPRYKELQHLHLRQLHFHLPDNRSFLRLHRPSRYGDSLVGIRSTVEYVNKYHRPIDGFECGKIFDGYRYVFPITSATGRHLGSVEISFAPVALTTSMMKQYMVLSNFFVDEEKIKNAVFSDEAMKNYEQSHHDGYLYDKEVLRELKAKTNKVIEKLKPSQHTVDMVFKNAHEGKVLSYADKSIEAIITTIPVYTPLSNDLAGFFTVRSHDHYINQIERDFNRIVLLGLILLGLVHYMYYQQYCKKLAFKRTSELLRAQQSALRESELKFRSLFQQAGTGIARIDTSGIFIEVNDTFCDIVGHGKADLVGKSYMDITHADDIDSSFRLFNSAVDGEADTYTIDKRYVTAGGETVWVSLVITMVKDEDGKPDYLISGIQDITSRIQSSEQIAKYQAELENVNKKLEDMVHQETKNRVEQALMYRQMFNSLDSLVYVYNCNFEYILVNDTYLSFFNMEKENLTGRHITNVYDAKRFSQMIPITEKVLYGASATSVGELVLPSGRKVYLEETFSPFREANGEITGVIVIANDITEKKKLSEDLEKKEHLMIQQSKLADMGAMIGAIAHQWKQPLNILSLTMSLFQENHEGEDDVDELAETVFAQVNYMSQTVSDFRNFYNPSKRKHNFSVVEAAEKVGALLQNKMKAEQIKLSINGDATLTAFGFQNELMQVLINLINNSRDAIVAAGIEKGTIDVDISGGADEVCLTVQDNGGGIPADLLPDKLFEQFITSKGDDGTGIGLSMSKSIVEKFMEGSLTAENAGGGALFTICLPSREQLLEPDQAHETSILFVEDDDFTLRSMRAILSKYYKNIYTANNGREGLETFQKHKDDISLVITDIDMPVMNGIDMSKEIRELSPKMPVIVTTAIKQDIFEDIGFDGIFEKPVNIKHLNIKINNILSQ